MRSLKRLFLLALLLAATVLATALWMRRPAPPAEAPPRPEWSGEAARDELRERFADDGALEGASEIVLSERDLRRLLVASLADHPDGSKILAITNEVEADVDAGEVRLGLVVDLARAAELELTESQRQVADALGKLLLLLGESELYLGIRGVPRAADGKLAFGRETRVKVAMLELSLDSFAERFGVEAQRVEQGIAFELPYFRVSEVEVLADAVRLRVSAA